MTYDFCLSCGVLLAPGVFTCPVCGFNNAFDQDGDMILDERFLDAFNETFANEGDQPG